MVLECTQCAGKNVEKPLRVIGGAAGRREVGDDSLLLAEIGLGFGNVPIRLG